MYESKERERAMSELRMEDKSVSITRSMLCCNLSFPLTASCCLKSSFRGSESDGGGAI